MDDRVALVAHRVGIRYDLRLTQDRTLRRTVWEAVRRRPPATRFWAVREVSFALRQGEILGVVGANGAGKTSLLLALAGILRPDEGRIATFGARPTLLALGTGFEPDLTGRENAYLQAAFLGFPRAALEERMEEILAFAELGPFVDAPARTYSAGMRTRLAFAVAVHIEPEILLLDEVLGVGDASFQEKSRRKIRELMERARAIVVVTHSLDFVRSTCTQALWLHEGRVAALGPPEEVVGRYSAAAREQRGPVRTLEGAEAPPPAR